MVNYLCKVNFELLTRSHFYLLLKLSLPIFNPANERFSVSVHGFSLLQLMSWVRGKYARLLSL